MTPTTALKALIEARNSLVAYADLSGVAAAIQRIDIARAALSAPAQDAQADDAIRDLIHFVRQRWQGEFTYTSEEVMERWKRGEFPYEAARTQPATPAAADLSRQDAAATVPVGGEGWVRVRVDTQPDSQGWCFCSPASHPEDIARGHKESFDDGLQMLGQVFATPPAAPQASTVPAFQVTGAPFYLVNPEGLAEATESSAVMAWVRLTGTYKTTLEALLGYEQKGWRVVSSTQTAPQAVPLTDAQATAGQGRLPCGHEQALLIRSAQTGEPLYCEACDDKSGRADAEAMEQELREKLDAATLKPQAPALVPLTDAQIKRGWAAVSLHPHVDARFIEGVRFAERHHGITPAATKEQSK